MNRILRDAWVLLGLAFSQTLMTCVFVTLVPYGYLAQKASVDEDIRLKLQELATFAESTADQALTGAEFLQQNGPTVAYLLETVPWGGLAFFGSLLIYPFLGWWSARLLHQPQLGGILILGSVVAQQNIAMIPQNIEFWNVAEVSLSLPTVLFLIALQFVLFTMGLLAQKGQALMPETNPKEM